MSLPDESPGQAYTSPEGRRTPRQDVERAGRIAAAARFEEEFRLYNFAVLNIAAFLTLPTASPLLRRRGR